MAEKNYFLSMSESRKVKIAMVVLNKTPKECYEELNVTKSTFMSVLSGRQKSAKINAYLEDLTKKAKRTLEKELRFW